MIAYIKKLSRRHKIILGVLSTLLLLIGLFLLPYKEYGENSYNDPRKEGHIFCGGISGLLCPIGYECQVEGNFPDAGGVCQQMVDYTKNQCVKTGCSGQICADQEIASTCEWENYYSCFASAKCERQNDGNCGWTVSEATAACLNYLEPENEENNKRFEGFMQFVTELIT